MQFHSTKNKNETAAFHEAILRGLPPDNGLYFPDHIPTLPLETWMGDEDTQPHHLATEIIWPYACLLYTSPSPRDGLLSRMPSSA